MYFPHFYWWGARGVSRLSSNVKLLLKREVFFFEQFFLQNVHKMHQFLNSVLSSFPICLIPKNVHFCKITIKMQQSLFGLNQMQKSKTFIFLYFYIYMKIIIYRKVRLTCKIIKAILSDLGIANRIAVLCWE